MSKQAETLAKLGQTLKQASRFADTSWPAAFFMTDPGRMINLSAAVAALPKGVGIIFRHYDVAGRGDLARALAMQCRAHSRIFFIAGDPGLAQQVGADGLHVPEHMIRMRRNWREEFDGAISAAVHSQEAIAAAVGAGVDMGFAAPVFATASHPTTAPIGLKNLTKWATAAPIPLYALGGITAKIADQLLGTGCAGLAAIGGFLEAESQ